MCCCLISCMLSCECYPVAHNSCTHQGAPLAAAAPQAVLTCVLMVFRVYLFGCCCCPCQVLLAALPASDGVRDGYLCREQECDMRYMVAFRNTTRALEWCLLVQVGSGWGVCGMNLDWGVGCVQALCEDSAYHRPALLAAPNGKPSHFQISPNLKAPTQCNRAPELCDAPGVAVPC